MAWTFYAPQGLHTARFAAPLFLVEPIIPFGGIVVLHGPKTAGKTQFALTLGIAVAHGRTFLHEYTCRKGPVVFLEADMTIQTLQARVQNAPDTQVLHFLHADPFDVVRLSRQPLPEAIMQAQTAQPSLVIVDSLRKTHAQDEVASSTPSLVYAAWKMLFPGATLLFIHHDRKRPTDPNAYLHPEEAARGTGAWLDDADTGLHLTRQRETKDGHLCTLSFSKCRTTEEPPPMFLRMHEDTLIIEPTKLTARQRLVTWRQQFPSATREQAREWFVGEKVGSRALGYRLVAELWS